MVKALLISFYRVNNAKPRRIIFFRDGVSEGQFREVLLYEVGGNSAKLQIVMCFEVLTLHAQV